MSMQDAVDGVALLVTCAKSTDQMMSLCLSCFYIKRGSFSKLTNLEFLQAIHGISALMTKFLDLLNF